MSQTTQLMDELAPGRLTIDLKALKKNWQKLNEMAGTAECAASVKANAYGIEVERAIPALWAAGCRTFFVATPLEGLEIRNIRNDATVYILNGLIPNAVSFYQAHRLRPVLNSFDQVEEWSKTAENAPAALHVDTGMNRLGLREEEAQDLALQQTLVEKLNLTLLMSHLVCGDTPSSLMNGCQLSSFQEIAALFPKLPRSLANSAGIFQGSAFHMDLVRPGIALYGGSALGTHINQNPMTPVVKAEARILQTRHVKAHESIGYTAAEVVDHDCNIAIVAAGYADGYIRTAGSTTKIKGASAYVNGRTVPLVGRVSMDMLAVDITDVEGVQTGDYVELFGPNVSASMTAKAGQTIDYELFTGLGSRYHRIYQE